jgi:hypothetical protein
MKPAVAHQLAMTVLMTLKAPAAPEAHRGEHD